MLIDLQHFCSFSSLRHVSNTNHLLRLVIILRPFRHFLPFISSSAARPLRHYLLNVCLNQLTILPNDCNFSCLSQNYFIQLHSRLQSYSLHSALGTDFKVFRIMCLTMSSHPHVSTHTRQIFNQSERSTFLSYSSSK